MRSHGRDGTAMVALGFNYRLSDLNATLALSQLSRAEANIAERNRLAARYDELLSGTDTTPVPHKDSHRHLYQVLVKDRDRVQVGLKERGIGTAIHYPSMAHQPYYIARFGTPDGLGWALDFASQTLSIPLFPGLTEQDQQRVVDALKESL